MKIISSDAIRNKKVLLRLDLDVPIEKNTIKDLTRLKSVIPTLEILKEAAQIIIIGHLGRPKGTVVDELRLGPLAYALWEITGSHINYVQTWDDQQIKDSLRQNHQWNLLENLRFHPGEDTNNLEFAAQLASYADIFVFEAFAVCHRAAASTVGVTHHLPSFAGLRVAKEVEILSHILKNPQHPFLAIIGGAKIETKLPVITNLIQSADTLFVGGKLIKEIEDQHLTFDPKVVVGTDIPSGFDIDEPSQQKVKDLIASAKLIVWNGPAGKFEDPASQAGTKAITEALAYSSAEKIIGGGETMEAVQKFGIADKITFMSVGGGAMLEFLSGAPLPALEALKNSEGGTMKLAINGFGRIGRNAFKIAWDKFKDRIEIVGVNDISTPSILAHLLKYDSNYGVWKHDVTADDKHIIVDGTKIPVFAEKEPNKLPWGSLGVDVVIESTGFFTNEVGMKLHLDAGAKKVVLSAPAKGDNVPTYVLGVNNYQGEQLINNASCTTNCITPVAQVIHDTFGIAKAMMTTVHSYTASQALQDAPKKDIREARAAAENIVPTTTGAAIATSKVIPDLKGKFDGLSVRVPTAVVSLADFTFVVKRPTSVEEVNDALKKAAAEPRWKGILACTEEELVSSDFKGNEYSSIVDLKLTRVIDGDLVKVVAWYDNEWGYSNRLVEQCINVAK